MPRTSILDLTQSDTTEAGLEVAQALSRRGRLTGGAVRSIARTMAMPEQFMRRLRELEDAGELEVRDG